MSRRELQDVVIEGRSENLEFKRATEKRTEAARTVSAMRNGMGGFVVRLTPRQIGQLPFHQEKTNRRLEKDKHFDAVL